jgi:hypothetical protein
LFHFQDEFKRVITILEDAILATDLVPISLNFFPSALTTRSKKLEGQSLETFSSQVLEFKGKV